MDTKESSRIDANGATTTCLFTASIRENDAAHIAARSCRSYPRCAQCDDVPEDNNSSGGGRGGEGRARVAGHTAGATTTTTTARCIRSNIRSTMDICG